MNKLALSKFHDAMLEQIVVDWEFGKATLYRRTSDGTETLGFENVRSIEIPREYPWGPSVSINEVRDRPEICEIEMQSGDVITIKKGTSKD